MSHMRAELTDIYTFGNPDAENLLIQMVDDHDLDVIRQEVADIHRLSPDRDFCLIAVRVNNWNEDLSPWPAPAAFGTESFGNGADNTLAFLLEELIPNCSHPSRASELHLTQASGANHSYEAGPHSGLSDRTLYIGGYSLAGLFALWAVYQTDIFAGAAAASPSIWFPDFTDYMKGHAVRTDAVYLSLGDREERTRNPMMSQVGNAIRNGYSILTDCGCNCILEWNKGNHFKEPDLRTAKGFAWLLNLHPPKSTWP